jgi:hypothetical protein
MAESAGCQLDSDLYPAREVSLVQASFTPGLPAPYFGGSAGLGSLRRGRRGRRRRRARAGRGCGRGRGAARRGGARREGGRAARGRRRGPDAAARARGGGGGGGARARLLRLPCLQVERGSERETG